MRRALALVAALAVASPAVAATKRVNVGDDWFGRSGATPTVTVKKNDTVKWVWVGDSSHNVFVTKGPVKFKSPLKSGGTWSKRITRRGTYKIICTLHPGMEMTLKAT